MIDCGESDVMIEMCGTLDISNTENRFSRHDISFLYSKNFYRLTHLLSFFYI